MASKQDVIDYITNIDGNYVHHSSLNFFVDSVMNELSSDVLGNLYVPACAYLVCSKLYSINMLKSGASGPITKEKLGDQEITYSDASKTNNKNYTATNMYYVEYLNTIANCFGGFNA
jgi:hypothetical protein